MLNSVKSSFLSFITYFTFVSFVPQFVSCKESNSSKPEIKPLHGNSSGESVMSVDSVVALPNTPEYFLTIEKVFPSDGSYTLNIFCHTPFGQSLYAELTDPVYGNGLGEIVIQSSSRVDGSSDKYLYLFITKGNDKYDFYAAYCE